MQEQCSPETLTQAVAKFDPKKLRTYKPGSIRGIVDVINSQFR
jgi:hypothetical protein